VQERVARDDVLEVEEGKVLLPLVRPDDALLDFKANVGVDVRLGPAHDLGRDRLGVCDEELGVDVVVAVAVAVAHSGDLVGACRC